jgi:hypothetical protein
MVAEFDPAFIYFSSMNSSKIVDCSCATIETLIMHISRLDP